MRPSFSDSQRLKTQALEEAEGDGDFTFLRQWWAERYKRPPNDPSLERLTPAELELAMYRDLISRKKELESQLENSAPGVNRTKIVDAIGEIDELMTGVNSAADPLIDKWEREIAEGKIPDLDEML